MLRSSLCDYSDAYIIVKGTITVVNTAVADANANNINKRIIFTHYVLFTNCITRINHMQIDDSHDIIVVMSLYK